MDAQRVDEAIRQAAALCDWTFEPEREAAPVASDLWWHYAGDVVTVACNTGRISFEARDELLTLAFEVWDGRQRAIRELLATPSR